MKINKKAALHNLGCKVNAYETEAMQQILENAGYEIVPFTEYADVYVVNTCSVTNMADRKSRQMLHKAKKMNPDAIVVGAGCYVQTKEAEALLDDTVDIVIGKTGTVGTHGRLTQENLRLYTARVRLLINAFFNIPFGISDFDVALVGSNIDQLVDVDGGIDVGALEKEFLAHHLSSLIPLNFSFFSGFTIDQIKDIIPLALG